MTDMWITLYPDSFIWLKKNIGYVYNSKEMQGSSFELNDRLEEICKELLLPANLYTTSLASEDLNDEIIDRWIHNSIIKIDAGYFTDISKKSPVSLKPIFKIFEDIDYYNWEHKQKSGGYILQNLHELTFYLNQSVNGSDTYFKQTLFPMKKGSDLEIDKIISFIHNGNNPFLSKINLVGNIFQYSDYQYLLNEITKLKLKCSIVILIEDLEKHLTEYHELHTMNKVHFNVLINSPTSKPKWFSSLMNIISSNQITCILSCDDSELLEEFHFDTNIQLVPIYNEDNFDFFNENVFLDKEDIENSQLTKREIFMHQILNTNDFGKLTILPDSKVYGNVNLKSLGTIEDTTYDIVLKELTTGYSWRRIRNMKPCCTCIYQWLCPSPSNYEMIIGKPNLCHIHNNNLKNE